jgi:hypothetical protein
MLIPTKSYREFEDRLVASTPVDVHRNFQIQQWLYEHAVKLGAFPPRDPLEGLDTKIHLAKVLNNVRGPSGENRRRTE